MISILLDAKFCATKMKNLPKFMGKSPKYDAISQDFGHKNLCLGMGVRGLVAAPPRAEN